MRVILKNKKNTQAFENQSSIKARQSEQEREAIRRLVHFDLGISPNFTITKQESPDFKITEQGGDRTIGLEHVHATHPSWEEAESHLLNKKNPQHDTVSRNSLAGTKVKGKALGRLLNDSKEHSWIWDPHEQAREKALEVSEALTKKCSLFHNPHFKQYAENWLLIVDKNPFLFLDIDLFADCWHADTAHSLSSFSRILFLTQLFGRGSHVVHDGLFELNTSCVRQVASQVSTDYLFISHPLHERRAVSTAS